MRARAFAKVNLSLRVGAVRPDGLHELHSLMQSIDWADDLEADVAEEDAFTVDGEELPPASGNLAWRGLVALRTGPRPPLSLALTKRIAVAAGLGGGSADAAAGLGLGMALLDATEDAASRVAPTIGADVPFCFVGGWAEVTGAGEDVVRRETPDDYAIAIVVPPFELPTATVFRRWDEMDAPPGSTVRERDLPVSLRTDAPLVNDLYPAAVAVEPDLAEWQHSVESAWGHPVLMSGSGPALFSLFGTRSEAADAIDVVKGARAAYAAIPVDRGWEIV